MQAKGGDGGGCRQRGVLLAQPQRAPKGEHEGRDDGGTEHHAQGAWDGGYQGGGALAEEVGLEARAAEIKGFPCRNPRSIVITRFNSRSLEQLCAMGGITLEDLSQSVAYQEIFGRGLQEGRQQGELEMTIRLLSRRCGMLTSEQEVPIGALPLAQLEALAEALLDFEGPEDLTAWLGALD